MLLAGQAATEYAASAVERLAAGLVRQAGRVEDFASEHTALVLIVLAAVALLMMRPRRR